MNIRLKLAIVESGIKGYEVAAQMKILNTRLSGIIAESITPREAEKVLLAKILGREQSVIFTT